ncbi:hypothetical protein Phum_PHUM565450 [Pediculus humanus corporis]|uniref:Uncharacterized protein n=1 Tax=Pediculus humanus subsp. corporis TaxID=121224 RepID=E0W0Y5_PEDHC|nr:uncharacterized protein Phum_PHUM565450 [Pediculus humanus corporis]EEB19290.1 hypothetical protein Phum_PHUM565450 [Pediculus humanus corporis]
MSSSKDFVVYQQPFVYFEPIYTDLGKQKKPFFLPVLQQEYYPYETLPVPDSYYYSPTTVFEYPIKNPEGVTDKITIETYEPNNYQRKENVIVQVEHNFVTTGQNLLPETQQQIIYHHQYPEYFI